MKEFIEFRPNEEWCRYKGILCNNIGLRKICGTSRDLIIVKNKAVLTDSGTLYTDDDPDMITQKIHSNSKDIITSSGFVFEIKKVKPYKDFKKDFPKVNLIEFINLYTSLDEYYNK